MRIMLCSSAGHTTPPVAYGSEVTTWYLAEDLASRGHTVMLIAAEGSRTPPGGELSTMPLDVVNPHLSERWRAMEHLAVMLGCDLVHDCSSSHVFADISHNIGHDRHLATLNGISFWTPERKHNICVLSEAARQAALNGTPAWGEDYLEFRTDPGRLPSCEIVNYGTATDFYVEGPAVEDYVLYVGRPHVSKGVHVILRLARLMPEQAFVLAWRADDLDHVKHEEIYLEAAKVVPNVRIVRLPIERHHEAKRDLYQRAKVFLQPSQYVEAFGLTAIEALACGTPIILANRGSAPEIIQQGVTGFLCESIEDYQQAIRDAGKLSRTACREDAVARFDKRVMAERYLALYERVLRGEQW